jgi:hypothetical protein
MKNQIYFDVDRSKGVFMPMKTVKERRTNTENKKYKTLKNTK